MRLEPKPESHVENAAKIREFMWSHECGSYVWTLSTENTHNFMRLTTVEVAAHFKIPPNKHD